MTMTTQSITSGQKKQFMRLVEDAADRAIKEADLDKDRLQRLIENGNELQDCIVATIKEFPAIYYFINEEVVSHRGYPKGYKVKGITEQIEILRQLFPGIGSADEKIVEQPLPSHAEGWFAIPRWRKVAETYGEAVEKVLLLNRQRRNGNFYVLWCEGKLGGKHIRQQQRTIKNMQALGEQQKDYDILVVPAQFGLLHVGRSIRRAREVFTGNEFGLGAFEIGCMLLTHPERLFSYDDLNIDCAGGEYSPDADGEFYEAFFFRFFDGRIEFGYDDLKHADPGYGSSSGFLSR